MARKRQKVHTPTRQPRPAPRSWSFGTTLGTTAAAGLILALAALGPATAIWTTLQVATLQNQSPRTVVGDDREAATQTTAATLATGTAVQLVELIQTARKGDEDRIQALVMAPLDGTLKLPAKPKPDAGRSFTPVQANPVGESGWSVDVLIATPGKPDERYRVPLQIDDVRARAVTLPARVPADEPEAPRLETTDLTAGSPINTTVAGFAASLLTGQGDIDRWCSPQAVFTPVTPTPYTAVKTAVSTTEDPDKLATVDDPAAGDALTVVATVTATTKGSSTTLQYPLELTARDGRWEISALLTPKVDTSTNSDPGETGRTPSESPTATPTPTR